MVGSRTPRTGKATVIQMAATGNSFKVEAFIKSFDPKTAAKSPETSNKGLIDIVSQYLPLETRGLRDATRRGMVKSRAMITLSESCTLLSNDVFDPTSILAAHLIEHSGEQELEIEYYSEVPAKNIAEHVVIDHGQIAVCESRPWRSSQASNNKRAWSTYPLLFEARPQNELEIASEIEDAMQSSDTAQGYGNQDQEAQPSKAMAEALEFAKKARERKHIEGAFVPIEETASRTGASPNNGAIPNASVARPMRTRTRPMPEPPKPWQAHKDDFLATPRTAKTDELEEKFMRQASLLNELVTPVEYKDTYVRSVTISNCEDLIGDSAYAQHMRKVELNYLDQNRRAYRKESRICKPLYDIAGFQMADKRAAFLRNVCDFGDIPFQGLGGFGLAVIPSNLKRSDVNEVFVKIALSQFLRAAAEDLECIVVTKASKLNRKRLQELHEAGIPIVFDFSGLTNSEKEIIDPLEGLFSKPLRNHGLLVFNGRLDESQASLLGEALNKEELSRMLQALQETALEETSGFYQARWTAEIIDTLTFGHEKIEESPDNPISSTSPSRYRASKAKSSAPWQFSFATFPPESMPTLDSANAIKRMHDVGVIWHKTLKEYGLTLFVERSRGFRPGQEKPPAMPDKDNLQEIGKFLGIDAMVGSLYDGVPLDYII